MRAILKAPVDLLWNGGIGTYVKASTESHAEVGDKANDAIRVDGNELRVRCVGEGGNLGLTQRGRIEYARAGGRINTDSIDNSAGVDTSDHEVNIKILLDRVVADGDLTDKQRNALLATMTDEVADAGARRQRTTRTSRWRTPCAAAPALLHVHADWMRRLEAPAGSTASWSSCPSSKEIARRRDEGEGLTAPELAVLLAYTKIVLADELVETDLPDDPFMRGHLFRYFPTRDAAELPRPDGRAPAAPRDRRDPGGQPPGQQGRHDVLPPAVRRDRRDRRGAGPRACGRVGDLRRRRGCTASSPASTTRSTRPCRPGCASTCGSSSSGPRAGWSTSAGTPTPNAPSTRSGPPCEKVVRGLPETLAGREHDRLEAAGRPAAATAACRRSSRSASRRCRTAYSALAVVEVARKLDRDPLEVARVHSALGQRLSLDVLYDRVVGLPRDDRWQTMARATLRDDLQQVHAAITARVLESDQRRRIETADVGERIDAWVTQQGKVFDRALATLAEICRDESPDLARLSVALRVARTLLG